MRPFITVIVVYLASYSLLGQTKRLTDEAAEAPNIIFILTDDQRFDALGHAQNPYVNTPHMDTLAMKGIYFPNAMVSTPICAGSRATILTGVYERSHGYDFSVKRIHASYMADSYPALLRKNGYRTAFYGKFGVRYDSLSNLFDTFEVYDRKSSATDRRGYFYKQQSGDTVHLTQYTGQQAVDFIREDDGEKPFCLTLAFSAPHAHDNSREQYFWQKAYDYLLRDTLIPKARNSKKADFDKLPKAVREGFNRERWEWRYDTPEKYQHSVKGYYRMIHGIDTEIGRIRRTLKAKGIADNTVIIIMGDNGYFLGERQLAGKWLLYDESVRVPLIIHDGRFQSQRRDTRMALNVDVPPMILGYAHVSPPDHWQGKSLVPHKAVGAAPWKRDTVLLEHLWAFDAIPPSEGLRTTGWKYFRYVENTRTEELYDLSKDPYETNNLAKDPRQSARLQKFRKSLTHRIQDYSDQQSMPPDHLRTGTGKEGSPFPIFYFDIPKGKTALGYRFLLADNAEDIRNNLGTLYDSGKIEKPSQGKVTSAISNLIPGTTYYWKIRFWDALNRKSRYSEISSFTW